jgi:hypothetical protein
MYAIVRRYEYNPARVADARAALAEVDALHEAQPGYVGNLLIDDGRCWTVVNL